MSWQITAINRVLGLANRDRPFDGDWAKAKRGIRLTAPKRVEQRTPSRREDVGGVHCVWLDEQHPSRGVIVYLHGGSYVTGPMGVQWDWPSTLAHETGLAALVVHYGMPPEAPYPQGLEDTVAVLAALRERGVGPIVLAGDSAGGGLTVATAYRLRDTGQPLPVALLLNSPWLVQRMTEPEALAMAARDAMPGPRSLGSAAREYAHGTDLTHPEISPVLGDPTGLPPSLTFVGDAEMFLPEDRAWVAKAQAAGCDAELRIVPGGFHVSISLLRFVPEARAALPSQVAFIQRCTGRMTA